MYGDESIESTFLCTYAYPYIHLHMLIHTYIRYEDDFKKNVELRYYMCINIHIYECIHIKCENEANTYIEMCDNIDLH